MSSKEPKYNNFKDNTFFIEKNKRLNNMGYSIVKISKNELKTIIECIKLIAAKYRGPAYRKLYKRLEKVLLPRLNEIKFLTNINNIDVFGIEFLKINQRDILFGLKDFRIQRLLKERGVSLLEQNKIKIMLIKIIFTELKNKKTETN